MPERNDRHTDDLFRVGAERHGFEYNEAAWKDMEGLLDAEARLTRWKWAAAATAVIIAMALATWLLFPFDRAAGSATDSAPAIAAPAEALPTDESLAPASPNEPLRTAKKAGRTTTGPASYSPTPTLAGFDDDRPMQGAAAGASLGADTDRTETAPDRPGKKQTSPIAGETTDRGTTGSPDRPTTQPATEAEKRASPTEADSAFDPLPTTYPLSVESLAAVPLAIPSPQALLPVEDEFSKQRSPNHFALIANGGFILGQAGSGPFDRRRPRLGLELEYRVGKKFAFSTGAFYNELCYRTEEKNYTPKKGFWAPNNFVKPVEVEAESEIIEVPLTVKYYLSGSANNSFYVAGGATSYILLKEELGYIYDRPAAGLKANWSVDGATSHYLGMGQFNIGYQRQLKGRSALKVEAFLQAPFTGIGHGNVRLLTTGLSLNYQFAFRR